jgi:hypothetical protein
MCSFSEIPNEFAVRPATYIIADLEESIVVREVAELLNNCFLALTF